MKSKSKEMSSSLFCVFLDCRIAFVHVEVERRVVIGKQLFQEKFRMLTVALTKAQECQSLRAYTSGKAPRESNI